MGQFATKARINEALFDSARAWIGHYRGGLAMATVGGCAMFGSICGSSLATAATMTQVALPEMSRRGYHPSFSTGVLAAGGTLGILIPPSVILVIYAIYTEQSIGALFIAAIIPGLLAAVGYIAVIAVVVRLRRESAPADDRVGWIQRIVSLRGIWSFALVFGLVIGGIYLGWFSPTEGASVGASVVGLIGFLGGRLGWRAIRESLLETAKTTAFIALILLGATVFNAFLALSQLPGVLAELILEVDAPPLLLVAAMLLLYIVLGCIMESLSIILLTIPVFLPILLRIDLGLSEAQILVWFGVMCLTAVEVGMITPPFGLNLFVINAAARDVPMTETYRGVLPFVASDIIRLGILLSFPALSLVLPGMW
jgi:tripartite ATP-independent transporter DctM subunit